MTEGLNLLYGSEIDEHMKKLKFESDQFLKSCGKLPLEIYRIENFTPVIQDL